MIVTMLCVVRHVLNGMWFLGIIFENRGLQQKELNDFIYIFNGKLVFSKCIG